MNIYLYVTMAYQMTDKSLDTIMCQSIVCPYVR